MCCRRGSAKLDVPTNFVGLLKGQERWIQHGISLIKFVLFFSVMSLKLLCQASDDACSAKSSEVYHKTLALKIVDSILPLTLDIISIANFYFIQYSWHGKRGKLEKLITNYKTKACACMFFTWEHLGTATNQAFFPSERVQSASIFSWCPSIFYRGEMRDKGLG